MKISIPLPPIQEHFDEAGIRALRVGRRQLATQWSNVAHAPQTAYKDWRLTLPFRNTYQNAYVCMCDTHAVPHIAANGKLCLYLKGIAAGEMLPDEIDKWIKLVGRYVAMKDFLALSFALDYEREGGDPNKQQTEIGRLRAQAKPYGSQCVTPISMTSADQLVELCISFLKEMTCYHVADCVVAMPPSDPSKNFNLPFYIAQKVASKWKREDLTASVHTRKHRKSLKGTPRAQKLDTLIDTIEVDDHAFHRKNVLLIDDLYQSGISMNYCALMLLKAGASRVFGLACEKTCRNDDNVGGG